MDIVKINGRLRDTRVLSILSYSQYRPTDEKMSRIASQYEQDGACALACFENQAVLGVIVLRRLENASFEIQSIAVDPARRGQGIASKLIDAAILPSSPVTSFARKPTTTRWAFTAAMGFRLNPSVKNIREPSGISVL